MMFQSDPIYWFKEEELMKVNSIKLTKKQTKPEWWTTRGERTSREIIQQKGVIQDIKETTQLVAHMNNSPPRY